MLEGRTSEPARDPNTFSSKKNAVYYLRRLNEQGLPVETRCIIAIDDEEAIELAYMSSGRYRAQLWQRARLVYEIPAFEFKHATSCAPVERFGADPSLYDIRKVTAPAAPATIAGAIDKAWE